MTTAPPPLYFEDRVAELLGLERREFKRIRGQALKKGEGWLQHGRDIVLTSEGLQAALEFLAASTSDLPTDFSSALAPVTSDEKKERPPDPAAAGGNGGLETLTVHRLYPNVRLLRAMTSEGELVDVRVRSNLNFRPFDNRGKKMTLQGRLVRPGLYEMEGRCPRFPGRY